MDKRHAPAIHFSVTLIMLFQVSALFVRSYTELRMAGAGIDTVQVKYLGALVGIAILGILMWPSLANEWHSIQQMFRWPRAWVRMTLASIAVAVLLWVAISVALLAFSTIEWVNEPGFSQRARPVYTFACETPLRLLLAIPVMSMLTPLIEETINRGLIFHRLLRRGKWRAIIISSVLFAALHPFQTYAVAFIFGILMAVQFLNWRTLWSVVITHGTFNLMIVTNQNCLAAYWVRGQITWEFAGPAQLAILSFVSCLAGACWLAAKVKVGADSKTVRPA